MVIYSITVLPYLLFSIIFVKDDEAKEISDDDDWQFVTIGDQVLI